jgi:hypothetical protein
MKVGILAYDGCTASMIVGVLDIFSFANSQFNTETKDRFSIFADNKKFSRVV